MKPSNETTFFVAAPGSTEYEPLQRGELLRRLDAQQLSWSQQIWCPDSQAWKKAREVKQLAPSVPSPQPAPSPQPRVAVAVATPKVAAVKVAAPAVVKGAARPVRAKPAVVKAPVAKKAPAPRAAAIRAAPVPPFAAHPPFFRSQAFLYEALTLLLVMGLVAMNHFGANAPVQKAIAESGLEGKAQVSAHCGFYVQPTSLVVNIARLPEDLGSNQFIDLITALAAHRPVSPLFGMGWDSIILQKNGESRFAFQGATWKSLAQMKGESAERRAMLIVDGLYDSKGRPVMNQKEDRMEFMMGEKNKALRDFLGAFIKLTEKKAPSPAATPETAPSAIPTETPTGTAPES